MESDNPALCAGARMALCSSSARYTLSVSRLFAITFQPLRPAAYSAGKSATHSACRAPCPGNDIAYGFPVQAMPGDFVFKNGRCPLPIDFRVKQALRWNGILVYPVTVDLMQSNII
jgi:hypothetical protein